MPPDSTEHEDMVHAALFSGQPVEALHHASRLDCWLSAHLGDIMESLQLIDPESKDECVTVRRFIKTYAYRSPARVYLSEINISCRMPNTCIPILRSGESQLTTCTRVRRLGKDAPMKYFCGFLYDSMNKIRTSRWTLEFVPVILWVS